MKRELVAAQTTIRLRSLDLAGLAGLARLARLANRPAPVRGRLSGTIQIHRTAASQRADFDVAVSLPQVTVRARGEATPTQVVASARFVRDGVDLGGVVATVPLDQSRVAPSQPFHLRVNFPARAVVDLMALVPPNRRAKLPADLDGAAAIHADLQGSPRAPTGTFELVVTGRRHGEVHGVIASGPTGIVVTTTGSAGIGDVAGTLHGTIPSLFAGPKLVIDKRIAIDETVELADRPLSGLPCHRRSRRSAGRSAAADDTPLLPLVPALFDVPAAARATADASRLRWDMHADLGLARREGTYALDRVNLDGSLAIRGGTFAIPNTTRAWHDIALEIAGDPHGVRLVGLDVREGADRRLHASGLLTMEALKPTKVALALETTNWLLIGVTSPVFTDAPTTELDLAMRIEGDLTTPIPAIDATIDAMSFRAPDRKMRAHQPERISAAGDVIFVDAATPTGKLPGLAPSGPLPGGRPLDVRVHIPNPVHVHRDPLDVVARGEVTLTVRPEAKIPSGEVTLLSGTLNLFAYHHDLVRGRILVSPEHPRGWLDLVFERRLPDADVRDLAHPERGARLTLTGEPAKPQIAVSGAVNASLPEVFSMYDSGHAIYAPSVGLPATSTVRAPRGDQTNILAFLSLAMPQLLFLDRVAAWADASEPRGGYGRIRNLEADRYTAGDRNRVRTVARPTTPGRARQSSSSTTCSFTTIARRSGSASGPATASVVASA